MRCLERRRRHVLLGAASAAAVLMSTAGAALAADVPKPPGAIENRGYELVNVPDKNQQNAAGVGFSPSGDKLFYGIAGGNPLSTSGVAGNALASRTAEGWASRLLMPPLDQLYGAILDITAFNSEMTSFLGVAQNGSGNSLEPGTLVRLDDSRNQTLIARLQVDVANERDVWTTSDLSHAYVAVTDPFDPSHQADTSNIYDIAGSAPQLVSVRSGTNQAFTCGVYNLSPTFGFARRGLGSQPWQNWVSRDGSVLFFMSRGDDCAAGRVNLYRTDRRTGVTRVVSSPVTSGTDSGIEAFLQAADDGSWVIYRARTKYDANDADTTSDVYRWTEATGTNVCVTCAAIRASATRWGTTTRAATMRAAPSGGSASPDGSRIYIVSTRNDLDPRPAMTPGSNNLYVIEDGEIHLVAPVTTRGFNNTYLGSIGQMTDDGGIAYYRSNAAVLNPGDGSFNNGGTVQWYRYDAATRTSTCVSCPARGTPAVDAPEPTLGLGLPISPARTMSDDGDTFFFVTSTALVDDDVNEALDIYEWHDGQVGLITDGTFDRPSAQVFPAMVGVTPSGHDFFFWEYTKLTEQGQDDGINLYDARIDGGFPPADPPPDPCSGDACQGGTTNPPQFSDPGSTGVTGTEDVGPQPEPPLPGRYTVAKITAKQKQAFAKTGKLTLKVKVNQAGRVSATATAKIGKRTQRIAGSNRSVARAGTATLTLRLTAAAKKQLRKKGKLTTRLAISFTEADATKSLKLVLKSPVRAKRR
jgi:hypothetical protein